MLGFTAFTPTYGSLKDASGVDIVDANGQKIKNPEYDKYVEKWGKPQKDRHGNLFNASAPQITLYDKDNKLHHIDYLGREFVTEPDGTPRYFQHEIKNVNGTNYIEFEGRKYHVNPR